MLRYIKTWFVVLLSLIGTLTVALCGVLFVKFLAGLSMTHPKALFGTLLFALVSDVAYLIWLYRTE